MSERTKMTHDRFVRVVMTRPEVAGVLLREQLPPAVVATLAEGPPELQEGTFVDEALQACQADALFKFATKAGGEVFVYVLFEHKSYPDPWVSLQLLRYMVNIWERDRREGRERLLPIVPLVLYHGEPSWTAPRRFSGLLEGEAAVLEAVLDFPFTVLDVGAGDEEQLSKVDEVRAVLRALKYGTRQAEREAVERALVTLLGELGAGSAAPSFLLEALLRYIGRVYVQLSRPTLTRLFAEAAPGKEHAMISRAAEEWGPEWKAEGRVEGRVEGVVAALTRVLRRRFGDVPAGLEARLAEATLEQLEAWLDAAIDASSLDAVFKPGPH